MVPPTLSSADLQKVDNVFVVQELKDANLAQSSHRKLHGTDSNNKHSIPMHWSHMISRISITNSYATEVSLAKDIPVLWFD